MQAEQHVTTVPLVAKYLGVDEEDVENWIWEGELRAVPPWIAPSIVSTDRPLILEEDLEDFLRHRLSGVRERI